MRKHWLWLVFLAVALPSGLVFWHHDDWWYYVEDSVRGRWPKFQAPPWEQLLISSFVGIFFGGVAVGIVVLVRRIRSGA